MATSVSFKLGRSVRSYRDLLNFLLKEAVKGSVSWDAVSKASSSCKVAVEMLLSEKALNITPGGDLEVEVEYTSEDAARATLGPLVPHRKVVITTRTGVDKHGNSVDDKTVKIETGPGDTTAEGDAEIIAAT